MPKACLKGSPQLVYPWNLHVSPSMSSGPRSVATQVWPGQKPMLGTALRLGLEEAPSRHGNHRVSHAPSLTLTLPLTLHRLQSVMYLDSDCGQPEFTTPGLVSLTRVDRPVLGPPCTHSRAPVASHYLVRCLHPCLRGKALQNQQISSNDKEHGCNQLLAAQPCTEQQNEGLVSGVCFQHATRHQLTLCSPRPVPPALPTGRHIGAVRPGAVLRVSTGAGALVLAARR